MWIIIKKGEKKFSYKNVVLIFFIVRLFIEFGINENKIVVFLIFI